MGDGSNVFNLPRCSGVCSAGTHSTKKECKNAGCEWSPPCSTGYECERYCSKCFGRGRGSKFDTRMFVDAFGWDAKDIILREWARALSLYDDNSSIKEPAKERGGRNRDARKKIAGEIGRAVRKQLAVKQEMAMRKVTEIETGQQLPLEDINGWLDDRVDRMTERIYKSENDVDAFCSSSRDKETNENEDRRHLFGSAEEALARRRLMNRPKTHVRVLEALLEEINRSERR